MSALTDIAHLLESGEDADERVERVLTVLGTAVLYDQCALLEALDGGEPRLRYVPPPDEPARAVLQQTLSYQLTLMAEDGRPREAARDTHATPSDRWPAAITVPLVGMDRVVGLLFVGRTESSEGQAEPYVARELRLLSVVAAQLAGYLVALRLRTSEERQHGQLSDAHDRLAFLARAGEQLSASIDYEETLASLARLAVPRLAQWCNVYALDSEGAVRRLAAAHADPEKAELMETLVRRYPLSADPSHPVRRAIRTGRSVVSTIPIGGSDEDLDRYAVDAEHAEILRKVRASSAAVVPLVARGQALGALSFGPVAGVGVPRFDLALAEELAHRAALAVDNARLFRELQDQVDTHAELNAALREAVQVRDAALGAAQAALETRDELLAIATHDLRTPLTTIKGEAQFMRRRVVRPPAPPLEWFGEVGERIEAAATRMTRLIDELLDDAQLQAGRPLALERQPTDLVAVARRAVAEHRRLTERHTIRLETTSSELVGQWDELRLDRVLDNLLSNAVKYSPDGGEIVLALSAEPSGHGAEAVLVVRDSGVGIPADELPRVFERFFRASNVGGIGGTGLGMAGVRQIVEQHGGTVQVESKQGAGTSIVVRLPLSLG